MSIYHTFDDIICIMLDKNLNSLDELVKLEIPLKFYEYEHQKSKFTQHIDVIKYAYDNKYKNILVFENYTIPLYKYNIENLQYIIENLQEKEWDILFLSCDIFYNPNCNAILYNSSAFEKILSEYQDYIDIIDYDKYLVKYSSLYQFIASPFLFTNCNIVSKIYLNKRLNAFIGKYYLLFMMCFISYLIKIGIRYKNIKYKYNIEKSWKI